MSGVQEPKEECMGSVSSDEINLLVQHYLQELGYTHSAFAFGCESKIPTKKIAERPVQPGALVYLIQKGVMYCDMEAAADKALANPKMGCEFGRQLNELRASLRESQSIVDELSNASRRMKVLPAPDQTEIQPYYLDDVSLILEGHTQAALVSSWSPNSEFLATGAADGTVLVWRFERCPGDICLCHHAATIIKPITDPSVPQDITAIAWNPVDTILAVGLYTGHIVLYKDGEEIQRYTDLTAPIIGFDYSSDGVLLAASADGGVARITDSVQTYKLDGPIVGVKWLDNKAVVAIKNTLVVMTDSGPAICFTSHADIVDISVKNNLCAVGNAAGYVAILDSNFAIIQTTQLHKGSVCAVSWSDLLNTYVTGGCDGAVRVACTDSTRHALMENHAGPVYCVAVACNRIGNYLASAEANKVNIWSMDTKKLLISFVVSVQIIDLKWSPDGRFLTVLLGNGQVSLIDFNQIC